MTNRLVRSAVAVTLALLWLAAVIGALSLAGMGYNTAVQASVLPGVVGGFLIGRCVESRYGRGGTA